MRKEANGNGTKLNVLIIEDLAKRNIIDEEAKQGFLKLIATIPKPPMGTPPGFPGNTIPGNLTAPTIPDDTSTDFLKNLDASSALLDDIAKNNSDSQTAVLMTDIFKKRISDIETFVSGNRTDTGIVPIEDNNVSPGEFGGAVLCASIFALGPVMNAVNTYNCIENIRELTQ